MAGLNAFIQRLERMAASDVKHRIMTKVADVAQEQCLRGFREQRDPYGAPWAPRKNAKSTWPLLDKSGAGVESLTSRAVGESVVMKIRGYMKFHQAGTGKMVSRKIFPEQSSGLGLWTEPVNRAAVDAVREMVQGRG